MVVCAVFFVLLGVLLKMCREVEISSETLLAFSLSAICYPLIDPFGSIGGGISVMTPVICKMKGHRVEFYNVGELELP